MSHSCQKQLVNKGNCIFEDHDYETFKGCRKSSGHPHTMTEHEDRLIVHTAKTNHRLSFRDITNIHGVAVSPKPIACQCREVNLISRYVVKKPFLMSKNKKDRLEWALRYIN